MADRLLRGACWMAGLLVVVALAALMAPLLRHGLPELGASYLLGDLRDAGRAGGVAPVLVSTLLLLAVCLAAALPLGLGAALYLSELAPETTTSGRLLRGALDVLAGVPSIVFGLFGNAFFCGFLGMGFSLLSGGLTLACMVLPILIRSAEAGLRSVPIEVREGAASLGLSRSTTVLRLVLPAAMPGVLVGVVLGIGRALAETAALIFTSGYVPRMPGSLWDSGRSLSVHVYDLSMNVPGGEPRAHAAALLLVILLVASNGLAVAMGERVSRTWAK